MSSSPLRVPRHRVLRFRVLRFGWLISMIGKLVLDNQLEFSASGTTNTLCGSSCPLSENTNTLSSSSCPLSGNTNALSSSSCPLEGNLNTLSRSSCPLEKNMNILFARWSIVHLYIYQWMKFLNGEILISLRPSLISSSFSCWKIEKAMITFLLFWFLRYFIG